MNSMQATNYLNNNNIQKNDNNDEIIENKILQKYQIIKKLGSGAYGHVWKVMQKSTGQYFALKKVFSAFYNQLDAQRTYREISLLQKIDHPNIIKLKKVYKADNNMDIYMIFQLMQSDIYRAIKSRYLTDIHRKYIIYQMASVLRYLHDCGIVHRDIKPSNVLIDNECRIKLCDFGLSRTLFRYNQSNNQANDQQNNLQITQFIATRWYRSPQVMLGGQYYNTKSDIWSFGCFIYELYTNTVLFQGHDNVDMIVKLIEFKGLPTQAQKKSLKIQNINIILSNFNIKQKVEQFYWDKITDKKLKILLQGLFQYHPQKRLTADQILSSEYLSQLRSLDEETEGEMLIRKKKIRLEHDENVKLSKQEYREMIYEYFVEKESFQNQRNSEQNCDQDKKIMIEDAGIQAQLDYKQLDTGLVYGHDQTLMKKIKFFENNIGDENKKQTKQTKKFYERTVKYNSQHSGSSKKYPQPQYYNKVTVLIKKQKQKKDQNKQNDSNLSISPHKTKKIFEQKDKIRNSQAKNNNLHMVLRKSLHRPSRSNLILSPIYQKQLITKEDQKQHRKQIIVSRLGGLKSVHTKFQSLNTSFELKNKLKKELVVSINKSIIKPSLGQLKEKKQHSQVYRHIKNNSIENIQRNSVNQKLPHIISNIKITTQLLQPQKITKKSKIKLNR